MSRSTFTFDTTHHALWAEEIAIERRIPHEIVPAPPAANARCDIALDVLPDSAGELSGALADAGIEFTLYRDAG